ncbi:hypothetical protein CASFOL_040879 [Castilleja foliolosa]|uniref:Uncharacterized protein n=1 Tax=Castilleja foliolosa TaxID=1961234 RepID=A0ABD3BCV0_9LAMI
MTTKKGSLTNIDLVEKMKLYEKKKKELIKKASAIRRIYKVDACAILYPPDGSGPEVWPSQAVAEAVLNRFIRTPESERVMMDPKSFALKQMARKKKKEAKKKSGASTSGTKAVEQEITDDKSSDN